MAKAWWCSIWAIHIPSNIRCPTELTPPSILSKPSSRLPESTGRKLARWLLRCGLCVRLIRIRTRVCATRANGSRRRLARPEQNSGRPLASGFEKYRSLGPMGPTTKDRFYADKNIQEYEPAAHPRAYPEKDAGQR